MQFFLCTSSTIFVYSAKFSLYIVHKRKLLSPGLDKSLSQHLADIRDNDKRLGIRLHNQLF